MITCDFKSYTAAKRFKSAMRRDGIEVALYECHGFFKGLWVAAWKPAHA